jgi:hypothetical protein
MAPPHKQAVGQVQPLWLKKLSFGGVCLFCLLIGVLILDPDNDETWAALPMLLPLIGYHFLLGLNVANVYKYGDDILVEHAWRGEFLFPKDEVVAVKAGYWLNKVSFADTSFWFSHAPGYTKAMLLAQEKEYEAGLLQVLKR